MEIWTSSTASRTYGFMLEHVTAYRVSGAAQADPRPDVVTNGDQCRLRLAGSPIARMRCPTFAKTRSKTDHPFPFSLLTRSARTVAARSATSPISTTLDFRGGGSTPDVPFECELPRQVELEPGIGIGARPFVKLTAYTVPYGHEQDHLRRQFEPASSDGDQPRRIGNTLAVELREQLEPRQDVAFGRHAEDPVVRSVLHEVSSHLAIDLKVEHLHRDFSGQQELASFFRDAPRHRGVGHVEVELRIDGPRDPLAFLPDEAPFDAHRGFACARLGSLFLVLQRDPGHLELQLNPTSDPVIQIDARHLDVFLGAGFLRQHGDVDLPVAGAGRVRIVRDERRATLGDSECR